MYFRVSLHVSYHLRFQEKRQPSSPVHILSSTYSTSDPAPSRAMWAVSMAVYGYTNSSRHVNLGPPFGTETRSLAATSPLARSLLFL